MPASDLPSTELKARHWEESAHLFDSFPGVLDCLVRSEWQEFPCSQGELKIKIHYGHGPEIITVPLGSLSLTKYPADHVHIKRIWNPEIPKTQPSEKIGSLGTIGNLVKPWFFPSKWGSFPKHLSTVTPCSVPHTVETLERQHLNTRFRAV